MNFGFAEIAIGFLLLVAALGGSVLVVFGSVTALRGLFSGGPNRRLQRCPACSKNISARATSCPNCGDPL